MRVINSRLLSYSSHVIQRVAIASLVCITATRSLRASDVFVRIGVTNAEPNHTYAIEAWESCAMSGNDDNWRLGTIQTGSDGTGQQDLVITNGLLPDGSVLNDGVGTDRLVIILDRAIPGCSCGDRFSIPGMLITGCGTSVPLLTVSPNGGVQCDGQPFGPGSGITSGFAFAGLQSMDGPIVIQPNSSGVCPNNAASFSVTTVGNGPTTYLWQIETAPGTWLGLGNDPMPLPCGGGAFAYATPINSPSVNIGVHPCPGLSTYRVRCHVTNGCGNEDSNPANLTIVTTGDMNCDCTINGLDVAPFVLALLNSSAYEVAHPDCEILHGDVNGDLAVNQLDIQSFANCTLAGACP